MIKTSFFILVIAFCMLQITSSKAQSPAQAPVRLAVAGLTHGHAAFILDRAKKGKQILNWWVYMSQIRNLQTVGKTI